MKRMLALLLTMCMILSIAACGEAPTAEPTVPPSLSAVAGWWAKPADFEGVTTLYAFRVDAKAGAIVSCDEYGNEFEVMTCWYDEKGFTIDAGEFFGLVTYLLEDDTLVDESGEVHYVRCEPILPENAPYTLDDVKGTWYKEGAIEDGEMLIIGDGDYQVSLMDYVSEVGTASVQKHITYYDNSEYSGPAVVLEDEAGFSSTLWILDDGNSLYDDFRNMYYIKAAAPELEAKYAVIRDDWYVTEENSTYIIQFSFFGELWMCVNENDSFGNNEVIGHWSVAGNTVTVEFTDGSVETFDVSAKEITFAFTEKTFVRHEYW